MLLLLLNNTKYVAECVVARLYTLYNQRPSKEAWLGNFQCVSLSGRALREYIFDIVWSYLMLFGFHGIPYFSGFKSKVIKIDDRRGFTNQMAVVPDGYICCYPLQHGTGSVTRTPAAYTKWKIWNLKQTAELDTLMYDWRHFLNGTVACTCQ